MKGLFELQSASDLYQKLEWDFENLQRDYRDSRTAYNFVVTAYHLLEWVVPDADPDCRAKRTKFLQECPALEICHHLAVRNVSMILRHEDIAFSVEPR